MSRNHRSATHSTHKHAAFYHTTRSENIRYDNFSNCSDTCKLSYMRMFEYFGSILVPCVPAPTSFGTTPLDDVVHRASHHIRHNVQPNTVPQDTAPASTDHRAITFHYRPSENLSTAMTVIQTLRDKHTLGIRQA